MKRSFFGPAKFSFTADISQTLLRLGRFCLLAVCLSLPLATYHLPLTFTATIPQLINFQGRLTNSNNIAKNGTYTFKFSIYNSLTGGSQLWPAAGTEDQTVTVTNGVFAVVLGAVTPIPTSVLSNPNAYLNIAIDAESFSPRQRLISSAYVFNTEMLGGYGASYYLSTAPVSQTVSGVKTFTSFPTMNLSTMVPSSNGELATKIYTDVTYLASSRTWSATQTFEDFPLKTGSLTPVNSGDLVTKIYADTTYLASSGTWSATQTFEDFPIKSGGTTPGASGELATKDYADTAYLAAQRTWTAQQTFTKTLSVSGTSFMLSGGNFGVGISTGPDDATTDEGDMVVAGTAFFGAQGSYKVSNQGDATLGIVQTDNWRFSAGAAQDAFITMVNWSGNNANETLYITTASRSNANAMLALVKDGTLKTVGTQISGVAPDISEYIQAEKDVVACDVVAVSQEPGVPAGNWRERVKVRRAAKPYETEILGVMGDGQSSFIAGGAGYTEMDSDEVRHGAKLIVLAGRVPVHVTLENGPIRIGDYLTSSSEPGFAMKVTQPGPTVGIALENFPAQEGSDAKKGKVLCFVDLNERNGAAYEERIRKLKEENRLAERRLNALESSLRGTAEGEVPRPSN